MAIALGAPMGLAIVFLLHGGGALWAGVLAVAVALTVHWSARRRV